MTVLAVIARSAATKQSRWVWCPAGSTGSRGPCAMQVEMAEQVAIKEGLFSVDSSTAPGLIGGRCIECEQLHFPAHDTCPYCSAESCTPVRLSDRGHVYLHTTVLNRPPGYRGAVPFGFGVVELADGLRVISRLTGNDLSALHAGLPVRLVVEPIHIDDDG